MVIYFIRDVPKRKGKEDYGEEKNRGKKRDIVR